MIPTNKHLPLAGEIWRGNSDEAPPTKIIDVNDFAVRHEVDGLVVTRCKRGFLKNYHPVDDTSGVDNVDRASTIQRHGREAQRLPNILNIVIWTVLITAAFLTGLFINLHKP